MFYKCVTCPWSQSMIAPLKDPWLHTFSVSIYQQAIEWLLMRPHATTISTNVKSASVKLKQKTYCESFEPEGY